MNPPDSQSLPCANEKQPENYGTLRQISGDGFSVQAFFSPHNRRIRVIQYEAVNFAKLAGALIMHAVKESLGKIFLKVNQTDAAHFRLFGFTEEAVIPGYFNGQPAVVTSYFTNEMRAMSSLSKNEQTALTAAIQNVPLVPPPPLQREFYCRAAVESDVPALCALFRQGFESYPFPVFDVSFIVNTMKDHVYYQVIEHRGTIVAVASADVQPTYRCAEMTDFTTLPAYRGKGLGHILLNELEKRMALQKIFSLYTLARAASPAINRIFAKMGYTFTGTLKQNCHIAGKFEDMNCWTKQLNKPNQ